MVSLRFVLYYLFVITKNCFFFLFFCLLENMCENKKDLSVMVRSVKDFRTAIFRAFLRTDLVGVESGVTIFLLPFLDDPLFGRTHLFTSPPLFCVYTLKPKTTSWTRCCHCQIRAESSWEVHVRCLMMRQNVEKRHTVNQNYFQIKIWWTYDVDKRTRFN